MATRSALLSAALKSVLGLLTIGGAASTARAQSVEIPQIVIYANQVPTEAYRVGASVTVLSGDELRSKGVDSVSEALRSVPGVAVNQSGARGTLTQIRIRGSEARHVLVLIDGIEVNRLDGSGFDFADMPVDDIERIEVIRGPQAGLYGADAHAGVISIVTRSGKGLAKPVTEAKIEAGSRDTLSGSVNLRGASGPAYGSITVSDYTTRGYNISRFGSERDPSRAFGTTAKIGADLGPDFNIEGVTRFTDRSADTDPQDFDCTFNPITFACPPTNPATFGFIVDGPGRTTYRSWANRIGATLRLLDGHWIQSANVNLYDESTRGFDGSPAAIFGGDGKRTTYDYKSTFLFDSNIAGGERHTLTVLVDRRNEDFTQLFDPNHYIKHRTGLAGEYILDLPTNTTVSTSLRHDWNSAYKNVDAWRVAASQRFPMTLTRVHASAGKGVNDPNIFAILGSQFNLPNPRLLPEKSIGWDAGIEQRFFGGRVVTDVTYFSSDFTDKIELTFDPSLGNLIYVNGVGAAHRRGVEVSGQFDLLDWLSLNASYTYTSATDSLGRPEVRRPPHSGSADLTARFANNRTKATVGLNYNGVQKDFFFGTFPTTLVDLPAAAIVHAMLSHEFAPGMTAFIRGENVFDTRYEEVFSYRAPGAAVYAGLKLRTVD